MSVFHHRERYACVNNPAKEGISNRLTISNGHQHLRRGALVAPICYGKAEETLGRMESRLLIRHLNARCKNTMFGV